MADGVDIDLYADDLEQGFSIKDEFNDDVDLYDDVIVASSTEPHERTDAAAPPAQQIDRSEGHDLNGGGFAHVGNNLAPNHIGRRHQLYVGNLTWWTTDQDISSACQDIGVTDFHEVKFYENRSNGQSKGFCLISLCSETSMRMCLDRLPKKELHGQHPVVTLPTKQALNQFESQQKTRPLPPTQSSNGPPPQRSSGTGEMSRNSSQSGYQSQSHQPRMMNTSNGPPSYRPHMQSQGMQGGPQGGGQGPPRVQQQPLMPHPPIGLHAQQQQQQPPMRYAPNQGQWNGPPRPGPNGPPRPGPGLNGPPGPPQHRPMYQGPPGPGNMPPRGGPPRPDWSRPPMHGGFQQQGPPGGHPQGPPHMQQGPPRGGIPPPQMGGGPPQHGPPQGVAPHVNPAFFNQGGGPPHQGGPQHGPPHGGPQPSMSGGHGPPPHFGGGPIQGGGPPGRGGPWPTGPGGPHKPNGPMSFDQVHHQHPQLSEVEFEEIMARNRTVSSSAIARAVSDAAAGEYSSAIETLVTAISLIKQSKVAHDERCKILISSLQDTLHGIESKSYSRRDRSRSRERSHRRPRRERSTSRPYRERSRERDRERERERDVGSSRHYNESYREVGGGGGGGRERSRSRDRGGVVSNDRGLERGGGGGGGGERGAVGTERIGGGDHYRDESSSSRSVRPHKSQEPSNDPSSESSKRNYYDEQRYRSSDRDRDREREHRSRH